MIEGATLGDLNHFSEQLFKDMIYDNAFRPRHTLGSLSPKAFLNTLVVT